MAVSTNSFLATIFTIMRILPTFNGIIEDSIIVETPIGTVKGFEQTFFGKVVTTYLGIPYAEPPIGELRFLKPTAAKPRGSVKATEFSLRCVSNDPYDKIPHSEDCLYLNIWRPACSDNSLKPVMVWIHGGGFLLGSASLPFYNGLALAAYGDVLVVSMNYRLGIFGFLNLGGIDGINGNAGLHDQVLALQWIKSNIQLFGGDPSSITIFGQSAGGCSVGYHLVSPLSRNLFKRAILQSGATECDLEGLKKRSDTSYSWKFVKELGCVKEDMPSDMSGDSKYVLQCLQQVNFEKIMETESKLINGNIFLASTVTADDSFLPELAANLLEKGELGDQLQEVMIGVTSDEGSTALPFLFPNYFGNETPNLKDDVAKKMVNELLASRVDSVTFHEIVKVYFEKYSGILSYKAVYESFGDVLTTCPVIFTAEKLANHGRSVYFYEFAYRYPQLQLAIGKVVGAEWTGVPHFQEVPFVFGLPLLHEGHTQTAIDMSKRIITTWATFARTGKPADQPGQEWPLFTRENPRYFKLLADKVSEEVGHHREGCEMWRNFYERRWDALEPKQP